MGILFSMVTWWTAAEAPREAVDIAKKKKNPQPPPKKNKKNKQANKERKKQTTTTNQEAGLGNGSIGEFGFTALCKGQPWLYAP